MTTPSSGRVAGLLVLASATTLALAGFGGLGRAADPVLAATAVTSGVGLVAGSR